MRRQVLVSLAALCFLSGCPEEEDDICDDTVVSRAEPTYDFTMVQTFAVVPDSEYPTTLPPDLPPDTVTEISGANAEARRQLVALGLTEVDYATGMPDVVLFSLAASEEDTGIIYECVPGYYWYGWWGYVWDPCAWLQPVPVDYSVATVLIGLADVADEEVVFGGTIQGILECGDAHDRLVDGVQEIFEDYPADQTGM
jgi:hypothetical protein